MNLGWEDLESIQCDYWKFKDSNRISHNFHSFKISRDDKLRLSIEITYKPVIQGASHKDFFMEPERKKGEVYIIDGYLILEHKYSNDVTLEISGMTLSNTNITHNQHETVATIICSISSIKKHNHLLEHSKKNKFTIDWITNLDVGQYSWTSWVNETYENKITRNFKSTRNTLSFLETNGHSSSNSKCCSIRVNEIDIFFGHTDCLTIDKKYNTGFILYSKECNNELRKKIRDALSFILGCKLTHISSTLKDENYNSIESEIHTQYAINDLYYTANSLPPAPLHSADSKYFFLGENEISQMVQKIVDHYDEYDFSHFSWLYWHAAASPLHLKGVGFGATLEFIQRKFIEKNPAKINTRLVDKNLWKPLHLSLSQIITEATFLGEEDKKLLSNKLSGLNQTPQSILANRFYETLNLTLGTLETTSFKQRNNSAHGNKSDDSEIIHLIREVKILRVLCNRIILRIYNLSDVYNDSYSFGFPVRHLQDSITD